MQYSSCNLKLSNPANYRWLRTHTTTGTQTRPHTPSHTHTNLYTLVLHTHKHWNFRYDRYRHARFPAFVYKDKQIKFLIGLVNTQHKHTLHTPCTFTHTHTHTNAHPQYRSKSCKHDTKYCRCRRCFVESLSCVLKFSNCFNRPVRLLDFLAMKSLQGQFNLKTNAMQWHN